jgi:transposase
VHAASTDENTAIALTLTAGERHDLIGFDEIYAQSQEAGRLRRLTADRAYDADAVRARLAQDKVACVIPPKKNRRAPPRCSRRLYRRRHKIENWFRKLQDFRRLATRYEKLARCYLALVHLGSTVILLRSFVNTP